MAALAACGSIVVPSAAGGDQSSEPGSTWAGSISLGTYFSCAIVSGGQVRCWGYGAEGELGYPGVSWVGSENTPAAAGPVDLGAGLTATAITSGESHTCAIRSDQTVLCWGNGADGQLGSGSQNNIGDTATPGSSGSVKLPGGLGATAIAAGGGHTCAILTDGRVSCWGFGGSGELGNGSSGSVGADSAHTPDLEPTVDLAGHTAVAITAGMAHTCVILDNHQISCWGYGYNGRLGYGSTSTVMAPVDSTTTPETVRTVPLPDGLTATAISAGGAHTCAILSDGTVHCWGHGYTGALGYGTTSDSYTPGPAVDLGGRSALAISAGNAHTCAIVVGGAVLCWGYGLDGRLGYGSTANAGDDPSTTPAQIGAVNLGGHTAVAISAGFRNTCARLDTGNVLCWGYGADGQLGYCSTSNVGDAPADTPNTVGPVNLVPGDGGQQCPPSPPSTTAAPTPTPPAPGSTTAGPEVTGFRITPRRFSIVSKRVWRHRTERPSKAATFVYRLSERASVKIVVAPAPALGRTRNAGTVTTAGRAGVNSVAFPGWFRSGPLSPGRYRATLTATADGQASKPVTVAFTVVTRHGSAARRGRH